MAFHLEGDGEHYCFLNGTTTFLLMGWDEEKIIQASLSSPHSLSHNRVRVLLDGRTDHFRTVASNQERGFMPMLTLGSRDAQMAL